MASSVAVTRAGACRRARTPLASESDQGDRHEQDGSELHSQSFYDVRLASMPELKFGAYVIW